MVIRVVFVGTAAVMMMLVGLMDQTDLLKQGMRSESWPNHQQEHCDGPPTNRHRGKTIIPRAEGKESVANPERRLPDSQ